MKTAGTLEERVTRLEAQLADETALRQRREKELTDVLQRLEGIIKKQAAIAAGMPRPGRVIPKGASGRFRIPPQNHAGLRIAPHTRRD